MTATNMATPQLDKNAPITKRLYVGGLREDVSKTDLEARFKSFGKVLDVDLALGGPLGGCRGFGHITLETTQSSLGKCLSLYNGAKWKGMQLRIEDAKQDYMKRLKREWVEIEAQQKAHASGKPTISNKKRKKKAVDTATDMSLVTDRNAKNRKGWKLSRFGRAVAVFHVRDRVTGKIVAIDPLRYKDNIKRPESYAKYTPATKLSWPSDDIEPPMTNRTLHELAMQNAPKVPFMKQPEQQTRDAEAQMMGDSSTNEAQDTTEMEHQGEDEGETGGLFDNTDEEDKEEAIGRKGGLFEDTDEEDEDSDDDSIDYKSVVPMEIAEIATDAPQEEDDNSFEVVPAVSNTKQHKPIPAGFSDDDDDDEIFSNTVPTRKTEPEDATTLQRLAKERSKLLRLAESIVGQPVKKELDIVARTVDFDDESEEDVPSVPILPASRDIGHLKDDMDVEAQESSEDSSDDEQHVDQSPEEKPHDIKKDDTESPEANSEDESGSDSHEVKAKDEVEEESSTDSEISAGEKEEVMEPHMLDGQDGAQDESESDSDSCDMKGEESDEESAPESDLKGIEDEDEEQTAANSDVKVEEAHTATNQKEEVDNEILDTSEKVVNQQSKDPHYVVNTNLRALVFGSDAPEEGGLFSLFGDTNEDEDAKDSLFTTVEPTSFKLFPDPEPERMAVDDTPNTYEEAEVARSFGTSKMFFLHLDNKNLSHRSIYAPDKTFMRTSTVDEIKARWEDTRQDLTHEFKSKHKQASRRREKIKRQKGKANMAQ